MIEPGKAIDRAPVGEPTGAVFLGLPVSGVSCVGSSGSRAVDGRRLSVSLASRGRFEAAVDHVGQVASKGIRSVTSVARGAEMQADGDNPTAPPSDKPAPLVRPRPLWPAWWVFVLAVAALAAMTVVIAITPHGAGVNPDSVVHIETTKSLLAGRGFFAPGKPATHYGPVYPLLLAAASYVVPDLIQAARWLSAVLISLNLLLITSLVYLATERSVLAATYAGTLAASSAMFLQSHTMAWSEPPFIALSLGGFMLWCRYLLQPGWARLASASLALGLAATTRYAGIALLPPAFALLLLMPGRAMGGKMRHAAVGLAIALGPLALWVARNRFVTGSGTNRQFAVHFPGPGHWEALLTTVHGWFVPFGASLSVKVLEVSVLLGLLAAGAAVLHKRGYWRRTGTDWPTLVPLASALMAVSYLSVVLATIAFWDAATPLDGRLLLPLQLFLVLMAVPVAWASAKAVGQPSVNVVLGVLAVLLLLGQARQTFHLARYIRVEGMGYTSRSWRDSQAMAFVRSLPQGVALYCDGPEVVRFLTGRQSVRMVPRPASPYSLEPNPTYHQEMLAMCQEILERGGYLVCLDERSQWPQLPHREDLEVTYRLPVWRRVADATIYGVR